jgi:hypothetical protein
MSNDTANPPEPASSLLIACFSLTAHAEPGVLPRVLELFAKRGLVPSQWHSYTEGPGRADLVIDIQVHDVESRLRDYIAACLRQVAGVQSVVAGHKVEQASL